MLSAAAVGTPYLFIVIIACDRATGVAYSEVSCSSSSWALRGPGLGSISNPCVQPAVCAPWRMNPHKSASLMVVGKNRRRSRVEAEERGGWTFELGQASSRFRDGRATVHARLTHASPLTVSEHAFGDSGSNMTWSTRSSVECKQCYINRTMQRQWSRAW